MSSRPSTSRAFGLSETAVKIITTGLMLFALFFGAGNLIFPPVLGASAGEYLWPVLIGFCLTGVLLPLVSVVAVSTSGEGILGLARRVGPVFGFIMPLAVYLAIGPMYALPRVVTVAYELGTRPIMEVMGLRTGLWTLRIHAAIFIVACLIVGLRPSKIADRIGRWLTPALLALIVVLCTVTILRFEPLGRHAEAEYAAAPLSTGLTQGYLTMDVLAATVFGIVVIHSLRSQGFTTPAAITRATLGAGSIAAVLLGAVYVGLGMIGARIPVAEVSDGTAILRAAASTSLGQPGMVVLGGIVLLACLTTGVGLLSAFAAFANTLWPQVNFTSWLGLSSLVSFGLANLGLTAVLAIVSPMTLLLYPITIVLVIVTLVDAVAPGHLRTAYVLPVAVATVLGAVSAASDRGWTAPSEFLARSGFWNDSTGWILPTLIALAIGLLWDVAAGRWSATSARR